METEPLGKRVKDRRVFRPDDYINIQVRIRGEFQRDLMQDGLIGLCSQVRQDLLIEGMNNAIVTLRKLGHDLKLIGVIE